MSPIEEPMRTLGEILGRHAAQRPEAPALRADERTWTYRALHAEATKVARALQAEGVAPRQRVAILDRNVPEFFSFLFGASMCDAVTLAVNWRLAPPEMEYILNHAQARVLLIGAEFLGHLAQMPRDRQLPEHDDGLNDVLVDLVALLGSQRTACDAQVVAFAKVVA